MFSKNVWNQKENFVVISEDGLKGIQTNKEVSYDLRAHGLRAVSNAPLGICSRDAKLFSKQECLLVRHNVSIQTPWSIDCVKYTDSAQNKAQQSLNIDGNTPTSNSTTSSSRNASVSKMYSSLRSIMTPSIFMGSLMLYTNASWTDRQQSIRCSLLTTSTFTS